MNKKRANALTGVEMGSSPNLLSTFKMGDPRPQARWQSQVFRALLEGQEGEGGSHLEGHSVSAGRGHGMELVVLLSLSLGSSPQKRREKDFGY